MAAMVEKLPTRRWLLAQIAGSELPTSCARCLAFCHGPERPIIAKGNAGIPKYHDGHIHYDGTPELMAEYAVLARDAGAPIIGGCCGTMPDHLRAMRAALESRPKRPAPHFGRNHRETWWVFLGLGRHRRRRTGTARAPPAAGAADTRRVRRKCREGAKVRCRTGWSGGDRHPLLPRRMLRSGE